ncbi:hypothetical protein DFP72DRAFT_1075293 [Ephemerocybe angulata]|uniref:Secreted protein n=1 Tax=Ephemerocybe angulata TaxID=980116 RepID=A0A8H6HIJ6_9AGAR|nr:hypothetical protein DFP72DRAFT_1075293 [Tulosesus angulatus]
MLLQVLVLFIVALNALGVSVSWDPSRADSPYTEGSNPYTTVAPDPTTPDSSETTTPPVPDNYCPTYQCPTGCPIGWRPSVVSTWGGCDSYVCKEDPITFPEPYPEDDPDTTTSESYSTPIGGPHCKPCTRGSSPGNPWVLPGDRRAMLGDRWVPLGTPG